MSPEALNTQGTISKSKDSQGEGRRGLWFQKDWIQFGRRVPEQRNGGAVMIGKWAGTRGLMGRTYGERRTGKGESLWNVNNEYKLKK